MLKHLFLYRLKIFLREKTLVFWTLVFPFILSVLFKLVFTGFGGTIRMEPIPVAVVADESFRSAVPFRQVLEKVSTGDQRFLDVRESPDEETAENWLNERKIVGYIRVGDPIQWHVAGSGLSQSLVKLFLDQYSQTAHAVESVLRQNPAALADVFRHLNERLDVVRPAQVGRRSREDLILILYYALLAMASLYGAYYSVGLVMDIQGDQSNRAARINVAPVGKFKLLWGGYLASLTIHVLGLLVFLAFLYWILGVDFGGRGLFVLLTVLMGALTGLSLGALVAVVIRGNEQVKVAVLSTVTLFGAFLSGMMAPQVKYLVARHFPVLAWINPVNLLADAFYALYYYEDFHRFGLNMCILLLMTVMLFLGSCLLIRRRQYVHL